MTSKYVEHHREFVSWVKTIKQQVVSDEGVGTDINSVLMIRHEGTWLSVFSEAMEDLLCSAVVGQLLRPVSVHLIAEHYHLNGHGPYQFPNDVLRQRFADGDPAVVEAITMMSATADELLYVETLPYRYEGKTVCWDEPLVRVGQLESEVERAFAKAVEAELPAEITKAMAEIGSGAERWIFVGANIHRQYEVDIALVSDQPPPQVKGSPLLN